MKQVKVSKKNYDRTVAFINKARKTFNLRPVSSIAAGVACDPYACPVAKSITGKSPVFDGDVAIREGTCQIGDSVFDTPIAVEKIIEAVDEVGEEDDVSDDVLVRVIRS